MRGIIFVLILCSCGKTRPPSTDNVLRVAQQEEWNDQGNYEAEIVALHPIEWKVKGRAQFTIEGDAFRGMVEVSGGPARTRYRQAVFKGSDCPARSREFFSWEGGVSDGRGHYEAEKRDSFSRLMSELVAERKVPRDGELYLDHRAVMIFAKRGGGEMAVGCGRVRRVR